MQIIGHLVVLGRWDGELNATYKRVAEDLEATYCQMTRASWNVFEARLGKEAMWTINQNFLKQQMALGGIFQFSHDPSSAVPGSFFAREVDFLESNGYRIVEREGIFFAVK